MRILCTAAMVVLVSFLATAADATIMIDNTDKVGPTTGNPGTLSDFSVDGSNAHRMLVVGVTGEFTSALDGITYGGVDLIDVGTIIQGASAASIWALVRTAPIRRALTFSRRSLAALT